METRKNNDNVNRDPKIPGRATGNGNWRNYQTKQNRAPEGSGTSYERNAGPRHFQPRTNISYNRNPTNQPGTRFISPRPFTTKPNPMIHHFHEQSFNNFHKQFRPPGERTFNSTRQIRPNNPSRRVSDEELDSFFQHKKSYNKHSDWRLPKSGEIYKSSTVYEFEDFQEMKCKMNTEKDKILENYTQEQWSKVKVKHTMNNLMVKVFKHNEKLGHVTRNWTKAYELFSTYPIVTSGHINSVHIGDQHGGMISALNHYLHLNFEDVNWNWKAICDNPYYEDGNAIDRLDDRLISSAYEHYCFGADYSGAIIDQENIDFLAKKCEEIGDINLAITTYTVSTKIDPHNKEENVFDSHFAGLVASLKCLAQGGNLVMLSFSLWNTNNVNLMYFLNSVFEEVHLHKTSCCPETSFEFYIIALNFMKDKNARKYLEKMKSRVGKGSYEEIPLFYEQQIPPGFLRQHKENIEYFQNLYIINYKKFKFYEEKPDDENTKRWKTIVRLMPRFFMTKFNIKKIPDDKLLIETNGEYMQNIYSKLSKLTIDYRFGINDDCNIPIETLQSFDDKEFCEKLFSIFEKFKNTQDLVLWPYDTHDKTITNLLPAKLALEYGKPIERVRKTLFITPSTMFKFVTQIEEKFELFVVNSLSDGEVRCMFDDGKEVIYHFKENYGQSERDFLRRVLAEWIALKPKKLKFENCLFMTHFSASFLRILASFYKYLSVNLKGFVELDSFKSDADFNVIKDLNKHLQSKTSDFIVCFAEMKQVNKGEYFEIISNYNSQMLMVYIVKTFDTLISKME